MGQATLDCNTCQFTVGLGVTKVGYALLLVAAWIGGLR